MNASSVQIAFECLPLRSVGRLDAPLDATPQQRDRCQRIKRAIEVHGVFNSYYLLNAECVFRLTNHPVLGMLRFEFEGTLLTDESDRTTRDLDLAVELAAETCDWLTAPVAAWFEETVRRAVAVEFDRYIAAGDLAQTLQRLERIQRDAEEAGGYLGMYL